VCEWSMQDREQSLVGEVAGEGTPWQIELSGGISILRVAERGLADSLL